MIFLRGGIVLLALFACGAISPAQTTQPAAAVRSVPPSPAELRARAREDVLAAYEIFRLHHPGMFDPNNPGFPARLRRARDAALAFIPRIVDAEGNMRAMTIFSAGLADGHASAGVAYSGEGEFLWPGFRTVWRGDALHILDAAAGSAPRGSILLGCDGRPARMLIRESAFYFYGRPDEAGQWWQNAPSFFERVRSPYETLPAVCTFRYPDGRRVAHRLNWQKVPEALDRAWLEAARRRDPIGITEPRPGISLIRLTSFAPDNEGQAAYSRLFAALERDAARIAAGRTIVIDLRNNQGGSSSWSEEVAKRLWGAGAVVAAQSRYFRRTRVWWLADPENIAYLREAAADLRAQDRQALAREIDETAGQLEAAHVRGDRFFVENVGASDAPGAGRAVPRRLPPVYVITDGGCVSACLDAVDLFTLFPGVKLVGAPTSADSAYLQIRHQRLPSGRGSVILPLKIWVGRPRAPGQVYFPQIAVNDLEWTTDVLLDHIERDLTRRRRLPSPSHHRSRP